MQRNISRIYKHTKAKTGGGGVKIYNNINVNVNIDFSYITFERDCRGRLLYPHVKKKYASFSITRFTSPILYTYVYESTYIVSLEISSPNSIIQKIMPIYL